MSSFLTPIDASEYNGIISSYYKPRASDSDGFHDGIDFRALTPTNVLASYSGTIVRASDMPESSSFGNVIIIDHGVINGRRTYSLYAHLSDFSLAVGPNGEPLLDGNGQPREWMAGDTVTAGQLIGISGNTGPTGTDPHLHFEVLQSADEAPIAFNTNPANGGGIGFATRLYTVNPLQFLYGDGINITHTLNTIDDDPSLNVNEPDRATVWGDIGDDTFITPGPNAEFTAANLSGKRGNDLLIGNINSDKLRGGSGNDTLIGGAGSDMLWGWEEAADGEEVPVRIRETADDGGNDILIGGISRTEDDNATDQLFGGNGFDTYHVGAGDIINDADGKGRVVYNDTVLLSGYRQASGTPGEYQSLDGRFSYTLNANTLTVTNNDNPTTTFTINEFSSGELGIHLTQRPDPQTIVSAGDINENIVLDNNPGGEEPFGVTVIDLSNNNRVDTPYQARPDAVRGMGGSDFIYVYDVDEQGITVWGDSQGVNPELDGDDVIEIDPYRTDGDPSPAPIPGENGATIYGEGGNDSIAGAFNNDWIDGGEDRAGVSSQDTAFRMREAA